MRRFALIIATAAALAATVLQAAGGIAEAAPRVCHGCSTASTPPPPHRGPAH